MNRAVPDVPTDEDSSDLDEEFLLALGDEDGDANENENEAKGSERHAVGRAENDGAVESFSDPGRVMLNCSSKKRSVFDRTERLFSSSSESEDEDDNVRKAPRSKPSGVKTSLSKPTLTRDNSASKLRILSQMPKTQTDKLARSPTREKPPLKKLRANAIDGSNDKATSRTTSVSGSSVSLGSAFQEATRSERFAEAFGSMLETKASVEGSETFAVKQARERKRLKENRELTQVKKDTTFETQRNLVKSDMSATPKYPSTRTVVNATSKMKLGISKTVRNVAEHSEIRIAEGGGSERHAVRRAENGGADAGRTFSDCSWKKRSVFDRTERLFSSSSESESSEDNDVRKTSSSKPTRVKSSNPKPTSTGDNSVLKLRISSQNKLPETQTEKSRSPNRENPALKKLRASAIDGSIDQPTSHAKSVSESSDARGPERFADTLLETKAEGSESFVVKQQRERKRLKENREIARARKAMFETQKIPKSQTEQGARSANREYSRSKELRVNAIGDSIDQPTSYGTFVLDPSASIGGVLQDATRSERFAEAFGSMLETKASVQESDTFAVKQARERKRLKENREMARVKKDTTFETERNLVKSETYTTSNSTRKAVNASSCSSNAKHGTSKIDQDVEEHSGIRIKNRCIPVETMRSRMENRRFLRLDEIGKEIRGEDVPGDWVTLGVLADKAIPRTAVSGEKYIVFRMTDLNGKTVNVFLFGTVFDRHWKEMCGSVLAFLNPLVLRPTEKTDTLGLKLDHPDKMMKVGMSMDFGICKAVKRDGDKCKNAIDTRVGKYCDYHVATAYRQKKSQRMEFASNTAIALPGIPVATRRQKSHPYMSSGPRPDSQFGRGTYVLDGSKTVYGIDEPKRTGGRKKEGKMEYPADEKFVKHISSDNSHGAALLRSVRNIDRADMVEGREAGTSEERKREKTYVVGHASTCKRASEDKRKQDLIQDLLKGRKK